MVEQCTYTVDFAFCEGLVGPFDDEGAVVDDRRDIVCPGEADPREEIVDGFERRRVRAHETFERVLGGIAATAKRRRLAYDK